VTSALEDAPGVAPRQWQGESSPSRDPEALIEEARARQRRRRLKGLFAAFVLAAGGVLIGAIASGLLGGSTQPGDIRAAAGALHGSALRFTFVTPVRADFIVPGGTGTTLFTPTIAPQILDLRSGVSRPVAPTESWLFDPSHRRYQRIDAVDGVVVARQTFSALDSEAAALLSDVALLRAGGVRGVLPSKAAHTSGSVLFGGRRLELISFPWRPRPSWPFTLQNQFAVDPVSGRPVALRTGFSGHQIPAPPFQRVVVAALLNKAPASAGPPTNAVARSGRSSIYAPLQTSSVSVTPSFSERPISLTGASLALGVRGL